MDILRYGHDAWGRVVVNGISWDLLVPVVVAGLAVIVIHLIYRAVSKNSGRTRES